MLSCVEGVVVDEHGGRGGGRGGQLWSAWWRAWWASVEGVVVGVVVKCGGHYHRRREHALMLEGVVCVNYCSP